MSIDTISASTITTRVTTGGCHMLKINGYSRTKLLGNGAAARSSEFEAGGHTWCIFYYPNGQYKANTDGIYLALKLITNGWENVNANVRFSLVPHHGKPVPATPYSLSFSGAYQFHEMPFRFIGREELEKSEYLLDDCFAVKCDIDIVNTWATPDPVVKACDLERMGLVCGCEDDLCKRPHALKPATPAQATQHPIKAAWFRLAGQYTR